MKNQKDFFYYLSDFLLSLSDEKGKRRIYGFREHYDYIQKTDAFVTRSKAHFNKDFIEFIVDNRWGFLKTVFSKFWKGFLSSSHPRYGMNKKIYWDHSQKEIVLGITITLMIASVLWITNKGNVNQENLSDILSGQHHSDVVKDHNNT